MDVWYKYAPDEKFKLCVKCRGEIADGRWVGVRYNERGEDLDQLRAAKARLHAAQSRLYMGPGG